MRCNQYLQNQKMNGWCHQVTLYFEILNSNYTNGGSTAVDQKMASPMTCSVYLFAFMNSTELYTVVYITCNSYFCVYFLFKILFKNFVIAVVLPVFWPLSLQYTDRASDNEIPIKYMPYYGEDKTINKNPVTKDLLQFQTAFWDVGLCSVSTENDQWYAGHKCTWAEFFPMTLFNVAKFGFLGSKESHRLLFLFNVLYS